MYRRLCLDNNQSHPNRETKKSSDLDEQ